MASPGFSANVIISIPPPSSPHHNGNLDDGDEDTADSPASALIVAMASLPLLSVPGHGNDFYEMDDVAHALDDWAVKENKVTAARSRELQELWKAVG
ncbi:hypothetical protein VC83_08388 [Pseudogymnoascus destructans]|uniref:Uncharacterized protein n=1 Tax=Pseudogymnoascus destructans TaxID=655981 RepID=A0A176ZZ95_9PEZI|nr:uncharacterized protein VC83_08388 [Pseudogymnoascus destructans]OAF55365.1 hypothetical protein VC83_08388 [Pseudogymnoascus destructans]